MLRNTEQRKIFIHQLGPCKFHSWKPTNNNINKLIMKVKERSKMTAYNGHYLFKQYDRELYWSAMGGPRTSRTYVREAKTPRQFEHYNTKEGSVNVYAHNKFGHGTAGFMGITGTLPQTWTGFQTFSGPQAWLDWSHFGRIHRGDRDMTNRHLEEWGVKVVNIDSRTAPRVGDLMPHKHKTYLNNFPWVKDPITNRFYGDADYVWKGTENFDYEATRGANHAAHEHRVMARLESVLSRSPVIPSAPTTTGAAAAVAPVVEDLKPEKKEKAKKDKA